MSGTSEPGRAILTPRGLLLIIVVAGLLFSSVYPMRRYLNVRADIAALEQEEAALGQRMDELTAERDRLLSDEEVELRARRDLGMVRPGEVPFVIAGPKQEDPPAAPMDPGGFHEAERPEPPSALQRWWQAVWRAVAT